MMQASKQDNMDLGVKSQGTERKPSWVLQSLEGWKQGLVSSRGLNRDPEGRLRGSQTTSRSTFVAKATQAWKGMK